MTFSEAAMIMMSGGSKGIQPIAITQYGDYEIKAPEGVDGYNPIHVNLKDRYQAGYTDGWMKCFLNIKTIKITKNGTYNAKSENLEGYNPVVVDVPDRYDEGYVDGEAAVKAKIQSKTITKNGTYYAADDGLDGFDPVNVNVSGGFKLPEGVAADDFLEAVFGEADVTDETLGVWLEWTYNDNGTKTLSVTNGMARLGMITMSCSDYLVLFEIDKSTGTFTAKSNRGTGWKFTLPLLIGFGDPSHTNVAKNVNK